MDEQAQLLKPMIYWQHGTVDGQVTTRLMVSVLLPAGKNIGAISQAMRELPNGKLSRDFTLPVVDDTNQPSQWTWRKVMEYQPVNDETNFLVTVDDGGKKTNAGGLSTDGDPID